jgi:uncharacterized Ntn-hydrolase superfamily protein
MKTSRAEVFCGTFSILAVSPDSNLMGVAVASGSTCVGDRVPHVKPGIGVIATQAYTNVIYGIKGLELLMNGLTPQETLSTLLGEDTERNLRQVAIMNFKKEKAVFTGADAPEYQGEIIGDNYIVIGNLLSKKEVISNMAQEFESSNGNLAWKMVKALKAGSESGGDKRGEKSAALVVIGTEKVEVEIEIGAHKNPIDVLLHKLKSQQ